jgi:Pentapeptide repeats (8 copies)
VIRRRPEAGRARERERVWELDLRETDLRGAHLIGAHLEHADLRGAHLEHANLMMAHLEDTTLLGTYLNGASLQDAYFSHRTVLHGAHLEGVDFNGAPHLNNVDLSWASGDAHTRLPKRVIRPAHWPVFDRAGFSPPWFALHEFVPPKREL